MYYSSGNFRLSNYSAVSKELQTEPDSIQGIRPQQLQPNLLNDEISLAENEDQLTQNSKLRNNSSVDNS